MATTEFSTEDYFQTQPVPSNLDIDVSGVRDFIQRQSARGRRVVLVTVSGLLLLFNDYHGLYGSLC